MRGKKILLDIMEVVALTLLGLSFLGVATLITYGIVYYHIYLKAKQDWIGLIIADSMLCFVLATIVCSIGVQIFKLERSKGESK